MFKPSELRSFLASNGVRAKRSLSQNFLIDGNVIRKIIATSAVQSGQIVLEIGPGPGALSQALLEADTHLIAVEKDHFFAASLPRLTPKEGQLEVFEEDILQFPIEEILKSRLSLGQKAKVVANLPYHLTTPILARLLPMHHLISDLTLMVQDEVAKRFVALPGTGDYSSFTIFLNFYCDPRYAFFVSRNCFYPAPKVDSAIVTLALKAPPSVGSTEKFFELTRRAFEQRRKMLKVSLRPFYEPELVMQALRELGKDEKARPETLALKDFLLLFEKLNPV